jgi:hypothetical protein
MIDCSKAKKRYLYSALPTAAFFLLMSFACVGPRHPDAGANLYLPDCVLIQTDSKQDLNLESYKNVLNAVALNWRTALPSALKELKISGSKLLLIIPMQAAKTLTQPQIEIALKLVENGALLVSEGITPLSQKFGFLPGNSIPVNKLEEAAYPDIYISWEEAEQTTILKPPAGAAILNREKKSGGALTCLLPHGRGKFLLLAAELDPSTGEGYVRFPYLLQEIQDAGINFPFRSNRLTALFDYGYRYKDNPEDLAQAWKKIGIQSVHVGTWHFFDDDPKLETYLDKLIAACHQNGILVYGWLELPHISTEFWQDHPEWREKTATGRDAHIDWRYVMNLNDPQSFKAIAEGLERLFRRFDWDGADLSELYFDSPSGPQKPGSFTPFNPIIRSEYKNKSGIDPLDFFKKGSPYYWKKNAADWKNFVEYRVELERDLNDRFIQLLASYQKSFKPNLDIVVTYVDNIYDPTMREAVGADVTLMFDLMNRREFTLVLEDPGTVWHLGPRRYAELAKTYSGLTKHSGKLGIDINIIERDVTTFPTQKQTGSEFFQLFYNAGRNFQTVMMYSEQTMLPQDSKFVACSLAPKTEAGFVDRELRIQAPMPVIYRSGFKQGEFHVDGNLWPCADGEDLLLPAGSHSIWAAGDTGAKKPRLIKLNGNLQSARYAGDQAIEFSYNSIGRAIAIFDRTPKTLRIDDSSPATIASPWSMLPRGRHKIRADF